MLILGKRSPLLSRFRIYQNDVIKKELNQNNLNVVEYNAPFEGNKIELKRSLKFNSGQILETSRANSNEICKILTLIDKRYNIHMSDALFNNEDFKSNRKSFIKTLSVRIFMVSTLINILENKHMYDVPILIEDFPNIAGIFLMHPEVLKERDISEKH